jgi:hypothetical protein
MVIVPITLKKANEFVGLHHRHHKPVIGHKFSIGLMKDNELIGVAIVGRPVARLSDNGLTAELTRLATLGHKNACSKLMGAIARVCKEMGYSKVQTYILESELGSSLKASGWTKESLTVGRQWKHTDNKYRRTDQPQENKIRYAKYL